MTEREQLEKLAAQIPDLTDGRVVICKIDWCIALPPYDGTSCVVHAKYPDLQRPLLLGLPVLDGSDPNCHECGGEGDCSECDGSGDHECGCGDEHDCCACNGSGKCPTCKSCRPATLKDAAYLRFAFDTGWQPFVAPRPWEDGS